MGPYNTKDNVNYEETSQEDRYRNIIETNKVRNYTNEKQYIT